MREYSLLEKAIMIGFDLICFFTFCFFANLIGSIIVGIFLFVLFGFVNSIMPIEKRIHADRLLHCFVLSILYLLYCLLVYQFALNYMNNIQAIILSSILIVFSSITTTDFLWWKPKNDSIYSDIDEFIKYNSMGNKYKKIQEFEKRLKIEDNQLYDIYNLRFKENYKHYQIQNMLDISGARLTEKLNRIATSFRIFCK